MRELTDSVSQYLRSRIKSECSIIMYLKKLLFPVYILKRCFPYLLIHHRYVVEVDLGPIVLKHSY
jgi:hypothetical protein